jgi:hypothetical protein
VNKHLEKGIDHDNVLLLKQIGELEVELKRVKAEMKMMEMKHCEELRIRDRKELVLLVLVAACCVIY